MNEELQSTNEELQTINDELHERSDELDELNGFLESILTCLRSAVAVVRPRSPRPQVEPPGRGPVGAAAGRGAAQALSSTSTSGCRSTG